MKPGTAFKHIIVSREGRNCTIFLNRPEKRNALNHQMVRELTEAFTQAREDKDIRTVILRAKGDHFCSGADVNYMRELRKFDLDKNIEDSVSLGRLFLLIYRYPKPVIAVVHGAAIAGGCGLATCCDFIYASENAIFGYPEVRIGFVAAMVSALLIRQVGERLARMLLLSGDKISAETALNLGLINQVCSPQSIDPAVDHLLERLAKNSPLAMAKTKEILADSAMGCFQDELERLAVVNAQFRETSEFKEGIAAFLDKRKPTWVI